MKKASRFSSGILYGLGTKITLILLLLSVLPLFLNSYLAFFNGRNIIQKDTYNRLVSINSNKQIVLHRWIEGQEKRLEGISKRADFIQLMDKIYSESTSLEYQDAISGILERHLSPMLEEEGFLEIFVLDASDGYVRISTDRAHEGDNRMGWNYFIVGKSRVFFDLAYNTPSPGDTLLTISAPVKDLNGKVIAVLVGRLNQNEMSNIMALSTDLVESEETYLVNNLKNFVTKGKLAQGYAYNTIIDTIGVNDCLANKPSELSISLYNDYRDIPVIGTYHWISEYEVCILTEVDQAEAFSAINDLRTELIVLSIVMGTFVAAVGFALSRTIIDPINAVVRGVKKIGGGNLGYRINIDSRDELGQLAGAIDQMAANLKDLMGQTSQSQNVLRTLSQAAQDIQYAKTTDEIFDIIGNNVLQLGYNSFIFTLSEDQKNLIASHFKLNISLPEIIEKTFRNISLDSSFPIIPGDLHHQVLFEGQTIFTDKMTDYIQNAFPRVARIFIERIVKNLGLEAGIYAPLRIGDDAQGILMVSGHGITASSMPAVTILANQIAIALLNIQSKQAQRSLESRLEYLLSLSPAVIYSCKASPPFTMTFISDNVQELLGYEPWEFIDDPNFIKAHTHPEDYVFADCGFSAMLINQTVEQEYRLQHKDGVYHWLNDTKRLVLDSDGNPQEIIGSWINITKRKNAEDSLKASENRLSMAQQVAKIGSWEYDIETNVVTWSDETFRQLGLEPGEIIPTYDYLVNAVHPEDRKIFSQAADEAVEKGKAYAVEVRMVRPDNSEWILLAQGIVEKNEEGVPYKFFGTHQDITEISEIRKRLAQSQKLAILGQLAGGVGHELRSPLGAVKNAVYYLSMLLEDYKTDPEINGMINILKQEIDVSERIISSLLDFTKSKRTLRIPMNINAVLQETLSRIDVPDHIEVKTLLSDELPTVRIDPDQLGIVFRNIMHNAIQAMSAQEGPDTVTDETAAKKNIASGRLTLSTKLETPDHVQVSISDTGIGLCKEIQDKIFEPLFTTKKEGIGLGMAITKILVEENDGVIDVESQAGIGTTFFIRFPITDGDEELNYAG